MQVTHICELAGRPADQCYCCRCCAGGFAPSAYLALLADANGDMVPDIIAYSMQGVSVGQVLSYQGSMDVFLPLHTCGDGVVFYGSEYCDALPALTPWAGAVRYYMRGMHACVGCMHA